MGASEFVELMWNCHSCGFKNIQRKNMDGKNDNIKEMSESQNKNSVIVKGDNVNVTNNNTAINNIYKAAKEFFIK